MSELAGSDFAERSKGAKTYAVDEGVSDKD